ncbi:MAG TPA: hypothetical protein VF254_03520 [Gammaproteobacteria bacterium]
MKKLLLAALLLPLNAVAADSRDFSLDVPAGEISRVELDGNVGEIEIRAADVDAIEVRVRLEPGEDDWFDGDKLAERLEEAELLHDTDGDTLQLSLDYDDGFGDDTDLEEHWEITLPARMALNVELNVGRAAIEGTSGGVEAEVNVGELDIDVQGGDIDASVNVGELDINSATESPGEFDLESNIGDARLSIDGDDAGRNDGWLGMSVEHDAGGEDDVTARTNVGEIRVDIR